MFRKRYFYSFTLHRIAEGDPGASVQDASQQGYGIVTSNAGPVAAMKYIKETKGRPGHYLHLQAFNRI